MGGSIRKKTTGNIIDEPQQILTLCIYMVFTSQSLITGNRDNCSFYKKEEEEFNKDKWLLSQPSLMTNKAAWPGLWPKAFAA